MRELEGCCCVIDSPRTTMSNPYLGEGLSRSLKVLNHEMEENASSRAKPVCMMWVQFSFIFTFHIICYQRSRCRRWENKTRWRIEESEKCRSKLRLCSYNFQSQQFIRFSGRDIHQLCPVEFGTIHNVQNIESDIFQWRFSTGIY